MLELNKVYEGDCFEVMKDIDDASIDMILADPPYGTTACKWDSVIPLEPMWEQLHRVIKPNGAIVLFGNEPFSSVLRMSNIKNYKYDWVWQKEQGTNQFLAKTQPIKKHENISIFCDGKPLYNPQFTEGKRMYGIRDKRGGVDPITKAILKPTKYDNKGKYYPVSVINFKRDLKERFHPTQKPVALFEYLVRTYTNEGDLVLDNVAGSGTTGVACQNTNRNYILIEKESEYVEICRQRLQEETKKIKQDFKSTPKLKRLI